MLKYHRVFALLVALDGGCRKDMIVNTLIIFIVEKPYNRAVTVRAEKLSYIFRNKMLGGKEFVL